MIRMVKTKNIAVLVSGGGTNLQALLDAQAARRAAATGRSSLVVSNNARRLCAGAG